MVDFNIILQNLNEAEDATCLGEIAAVNVVEFLKTVNEKKCNAYSFCKW